MPYVPGYCLAPADPRYNTPECYSVKNAYYNCGYNAQTGELTGPLNVDSGYNIQWPNTGLWERVTGCRIMTLAYYHWNPSAAPNINTPDICSAKFADNYGNEVQKPYACGGPGPDILPTPDPLADGIGDAMQNLKVIGKNYGVQASDYVEARVPIVAILLIIIIILVILKFTL